MRRGFANLSLCPLFQQIHCGSSAAGRERATSLKRYGKKLVSVCLVTSARDSAGSVEVNTDAADLLCRNGRSPAAGTPQDVHIWLPTPPAWVFQRALLLLYDASGDPVGLSLASPLPGAVVMLVLTVTRRRPSRREHAAASRRLSEAHPAPRAGRKAARFFQKKP